MGCNYCEIWRDARIAGQPEKHDPICIHLFSIADKAVNVNTFWDVISVRLSSFKVIFSRLTFSCFHDNLSVLIQIMHYTLYAFVDFPSLPYSFLTAAPWVSQPKGGALLITIDYQNRAPIYEQIVEKFQMLIVKGVLEPGSRMPSVRSLADRKSVV